MLFATVMKQMGQKQVPPDRSIGDLQAPQLVELAADSVERLLARKPAPDATLAAERDALLEQLDTWHSWSDGKADASQLEASAAAVKQATVGPARTRGDSDTLTRACVRMAADTARAASQCETAETPSVRERLLWTARLAADRLRMATELLLRNGRPLAG